MAKKATKDGVEPRVIVLAQQLGTVLGRAQGRADRVIKQVNKSGAAVKKTAADAIAAVTPKAKSKAKSKKTALLAEPKRKSKAKKSEPMAAKKRSGGVVDAPGKKHRQPPPQQKVNRRGSEPGSPMGQAGAKGRMQRGRG